MTALRAPTGGSSEGDADDASAETVSEHGESLREIAALAEVRAEKTILWGLVKQGWEWEERRPQQG